MNNFTLTFKLNSFEYYQFVHWANRKAFRVIIYILIFFYILINLIDHEKIISGNYKILFINIFPLLFGLTILLLLTKVHLRIKSKKTFRSDKILNSDIKLIITDDFIEETTELSNVKIDWKEIHEIVFRKKIILVMISPIRGFIIPKRCLGNDEIFEFLKTKNR